MVKDNPEVKRRKSSIGTGGKLCKEINKGVEKISDVLISSMSFVAIFKPAW